MYNTLKNKITNPIIFKNNLKSRSIFKIIIYYIVFLYIFYRLFLKYLIKNTVCIGLLAPTCIIGLMLNVIENYFLNISYIPKNKLNENEKVLYILLKTYYKKYFLKKSKFLFHGNLGRIFFTNKRMIIPTGPLGTFLFNNSYFYKDSKFKLKKDKNIYLEEDNIEIISIKGKNIYNYLIKNKLINQTKS